MHYYRWKPYINSWEDEMRTRRVPSFWQRCCSVPATSFAQDVTQDVKKAGPATKDAAKDTGKDVEKGTKKATDATVSGSKKAYNSTANGTKKATDATVNGTKKAYNKTATTTKDAANKVDGKN